jgi:hypothetical protein
MPIAKSPFAARTGATHFDSSADDAGPATKPGEDFYREDGGNGRGPARADGEIGATPGEIGGITELRELRDAVHEILSGRLPEIVGAMGVLHEIRNQIAAIKPGVIETGAPAQDRGGNTPAASVSTADGGRSQQYVAGGGPRDGFESPVTRQAAGPDGAAGSGGSSHEAVADLERRLTGASRNLALRAPEGQEETRALLEQAIAVMETLAEPPAHARLDDLKRRVSVLEQRVNNDRSNSRT